MPATSKTPTRSDPEWQEFFKSLKDQPADVQKNADGPSWSRDNWPLAPRDDLTSALDSNWVEVEKAVGAKLAAKVQAKGSELTAADVHQATRDSGAGPDADSRLPHARPLPRPARPTRDRAAARSRGTRSALLQLCGSRSSTARFFSIMCLGMEYATFAGIVASASAPTAQTLGVEFMHITNGAQKGWIQERIEGPDKEISFNPRGAAVRS